MTGRRSISAEDVLANARFLPVDVDPSAGEGAPGASGADGATGPTGADGADGADGAILLLPLGVPGPDGYSFLGTVEVDRGPDVGVWILGDPPPDDDDD